MVFLSITQVKTASLQTGAVTTLADANAPVQGWWSADGQIYFSETQGWQLSAVPADGSTRGRPVIENLPQILGTTLAKFSQVLPGGRSVLATKWVESVNADYAEIVVLDTETLESRVLIRSGYGARYVPPGYLVFARGGNLMAVRFDIERGEVSGEPVQVAADAGMESLFGQVHAAVSDNGLLAYAPGGDRTIGRLAWVDRNGGVEFLEDALPQTYGVVDLAPDGSRLAVHVAGVTDYIWIYDIERRFGRRLSTGTSSGWPVWSPDGLQIMFRSLPGSTWIRSADEGDAPREVLSPDVSANSWAPDGETLLVDSRDTARVGFASLDGTIRWTDIEGGWPNGFSPDGEWFAYTDQSDHNEIWVAAYPEGAPRRLISDRGIEAVWCACGELFYRDGNRWYAATIGTDPELRFDPPRRVFETDFIDTPGISYDVSPDGQRLLVVKRAEPDVNDKLTVVTNWFQALAPERR